METHPRLAILAAAVIVSLIGGVVTAGHTSANDRIVVVQPGNTLSQIAEEQGVSVADLVRLNGIRDPDQILAGQRLRVRGGHPRTAPPEPATRSHLVAWGESLTFIARRYGSTIEAIARLNDLTNPSFIQAGSVLQIPGAPGGAKGREHSSTPRTAATRIHVVAWGENLTFIARRYGTTVAELMRLNGISRPDYVQAGAALRVPAGAARRRSPAPDSGSAPPLPESMAALVIEREAVRRLIVDEAQRQGVPPAFALAVAWQESGWQQGVVSSAGAIGVMQLLPATAEWVAAAMLGEPVNPYDVRSNVRAGVALLHHYLARYGGSQALTLAAYYQGQRAVDEHGIYAVSAPYIASIQRLTDLFSGS